MDSFGPLPPGAPKRPDASKGRLENPKTVGASTAQQYVSDSESEDDSYGPALPPGLSSGNNSSTNVIGPLLPPHLMKKKEDDDEDLSDEHSEEEKRPATDLSSGGSDDEGGDSLAFGPLPPSTGDNQASRDSVEARFEARAEKMRKKLEPQKEELHREEWMTALPSAKKSLGLGLTNRTFKNSSSYVANEDRSVWTDTPADRERRTQEAGSDKKKKKKKKPDAIPESVRRRNEELQHQTEEYNKLHRNESLMTLHQKKRKSDLEAGGGAKKAVLLPFDPVRDMKPENTMSSSARQKVIANSKQLDTRFHRSTRESSFM